MCLRVKEVPTKKYNLVVKCKKYLEREYVLGGVNNYKYVTPYRYIKVPNNGLLISDEKICGEILYNNELGGEVVHSYDCSRLKDYRATYLSFAIGIIAYDTFYNEIGSLALYIPKCDDNKHRAKVLTKLFSEMDSRPKRKSDKDIILSYFPELEQKLEGF